MVLQGIVTDPDWTGQSDLKKPGQSGCLPEAFPIQFPKLQGIVLESQFAELYEWAHS